MFYTVYKITNKFNGKYYIGKHQTKDLDDGYMGSGKLITRAIKKYGKENFTKDILFVFDAEDEMNAKEAELVVVSEETYNLCDGGKGGWSYVNREGLNVSENQKDIAKSISHLGLTIMNDPSNYENKLIYLKKARLKLDDFNIKGFLGKKHSEESLTKMRGPRNNFRGSKNSQYGTMWITNGTENRKIKKVDSIPEGWYKGRKINACVV